MPRHARAIVTDIPYHIINRGNNKETIFLTNKDYKYFLNLIKEAKNKYICKIYSYIIMSNHFHLLLQVFNPENLAKFMKYISQKYAQYFNFFHNRTGILWENRFKSFPVSTDRYLLACTRYVETNCVRAGIINDVSSYPWSSYKAKVGLEPAGFVDFDPVYLSLGKDMKERQERYRQWINEPITNSEKELICKSINKGWALGDAEFKERIENLTGIKQWPGKVGRPLKI